MKRAILAAGDRIALRCFLTVIRYWKWRTGRPAIVAIYSDGEHKAVTDYRSFEHREWKH